MKFVQSILIFVITISAVGCSKIGVNVLYVKGDVLVNGKSLNAGYVKGESISIATGKNSSVIAQYGSDMLFALSGESNVRIDKHMLYLDSGRLIAVVNDDVVIESREVRLESGKALFELVSKGNVSVVNCFSDTVLVKGIIAGSVSDGVMLNYEMSIESVCGSLAPARILAQSTLTANEPLKDLYVLVDPETVSLQDTFSKECLDIINGSYGTDIKQRYSLRTLSSTRGALSEIITKSGKRIIGAARVSGAKMTIYTVDGDVVIAATDVKSIKRYNGE